jgi:hypothetical protein
MQDCNALIWRNWSHRTWNSIAGRAVLGHRQAYHSCLLVGFIQSRLVFHKDLSSAKNGWDQFRFPFQDPYNINTPTQVFLPLRYRAIYDLQEFNFKKGSRKPSDLKIYGNGYIQDHRKSASYDQDYSYKGNYPINYSEGSYNQPSTLYSLQTPNYTFSAITNIPPASASKSTTTLSQYHISGGYQATD